jgi:two-component system, OmpR family, response regulator
MVHEGMLSLTGEMMTMFHVLVTEDHADTRKLMETVLRKNGYDVFTACDGEEALRVMDEQHIDIVLLDVMMPKMDGYAFTEELRQNGINTPILMVTARQLPADKRKGFLAGTDDYMTKPVDMEEMLLRIRALLRRAQIVSERKLMIGEVTLEYDTLTVYRGDDRQTLPQKEFYLLYLLLSYPNKIFTRIQLMDEIWGMESESTDTTVNVHINRLRRRFENYPEFELVAVRGLGYKAVKKA